MSVQFARMPRSFSAWGALLALVFLAWCCPRTGAQEVPAPRPAANSLDDRLQALQQQLSQLQSAMNAMHEEIVRSHAESAELRREMEATRAALAGQTAPVKAASPSAGNTATAANPYGASAPSSASVTPSQSQPSTEENQQMINAKLDELHQTKVDSASRYRVRLSGIALFNVAENRGAVDNLDFPSVAIASPPGTATGSFGATLRQSTIGLEVFGPQVDGARLSANVQFDFAGGFPEVPNGYTFGVARLRTGAIRLEWPSTTVVAGQDTPFFSPLSPSSIASIAVPELAYSGNLWYWIPQVRVEHRMTIGENSKLLLQAGILDPLTGEVGASQYRRTPVAGEASRQPAYATRAGWSHRWLNREITLGASAYYSRENWRFQRNVDGWAGMADWTVPLANRWELSGEFYRGRAIGGLGAALGRSVAFTDVPSNPAADLHAIDAAGGWSQLKFRETEKLEWNGGYGIDNSFAGSLRGYPVSATGDYSSSLARNHTGFFNFIYRPRSDLLLSVEYRRLQTISLSGESQTADHINLGIGVLF